MLRLPASRPSPSAAGRCIARLTRRKRWAALVLLVVAAAFALATARLFVWPETDDAVRADAVVVFGARSRPERLPAGLRLMNEGIAKVLVLASAPFDNPLCHGHSRFRVICFTPRPFTTRGEARHVAAIAKTNRWRSLVLVTSRWHVSRARMLLRRCYNGRLAVVGARPHESLPSAAESIIHEWGGIAYAFAWARGC